MGKKIAVGVGWKISCDPAQGRIQLTDQNDQPGLSGDDGLGNFRGPLAVLKDLSSGQIEALIMGFANILAALRPTVRVGKPVWRHSIVYVSFGPKGAKRTESENEIAP